MSKLFSEELELPTRGESHRVTKRPNIKEGERYILLNEQGPGCLLHWQLTYSAGARGHAARDVLYNTTLEIFYDGEKKPTVRTSLAAFFGFLLGESYEFDCASMKIAPDLCLHCYFPIPFRSLRMELVNNYDDQIVVWFQTDWQRYSGETVLTPLRLNVARQYLTPVPPSSSI